MDLWKDLKPGKNPPEEVDVVVEIPKGSRNKFEIDKETGLIKLDRVLHRPFRYEWDYGFIPQTLADDGDPLDGVIIVDQPSFPGAVIPCRPIGVMHMIDQGEGDDKIVCVPADDPDSKAVKSLSKAQESRMRKWFEGYKRKEKKKVEITGFEDAAAARRYIKNAIELYKKKVKG
ncbi:MAG: inorganic diphosphatase [Candidatus Aenigmarchaeota archaeon]|nr:inorganic diphosphatase [Candidatus Aenigmarchaeota archaeon]